MRLVRRAVGLQPLVEDGPWWGHPRSTVKTSRVKRRCLPWRLCAQSGSPVHDWRRLLRQYLLGLRAATARPVLRTARLYAATCNHSWRWLSADPCG